MENRLRLIINILKRLEKGTIDEIYLNAQQKDKTLEKKEVNALLKTACKKGYVSQKDKEFTFKEACTPKIDNKNAKKAVPAKSVKKSVKEKPVRKAKTGLKSTNKQKKEDGSMMATKKTTSKRMETSDKKDSAECKKAPMKKTATTRIKRSSKDCKKEQKGETPAKSVKRSSKNGECKKVGMKRSSSKNKKAPVKRAKPQKAVNSKTCKLQVEATTSSEGLTSMSATDQELQSTPENCPVNDQTQSPISSNKTLVHAELLGEYYYHRFGLDFRCLRFPGVISADPPGGGTTDYAIAIFYDTLRTGHHECYLKPTTRLPMMYMEDCLRSITEFMSVPHDKLPRRVYNVTAMSFTPEELFAEVQKRLPSARISYKPDARQQIADSWPQVFDDSEARVDWGWKHKYGLSQLVDLMIRDIHGKPNGNSAK